MTRVIGIMPCLGRKDATLELIPRLLATAGYTDWKLICVVDGDRDLANAIKFDGVEVLLAKPGGYWNAMRAGCEHSTAPLIANLANDLLPGREWLGRAVAAYDHRFTLGKGVMGFNDGVHSGRTAAHFVIARSLLQEWYGAEYWPTFYTHAYGDTEICARALQSGLFAVAPFSILYHSHPITGGKDDAVYAKGRREWERDARKYKLRQAAGWTG